MHGTRRTCNQGAGDVRVAELHSSLLFNPLQCPLYAIGGKRLVRVKGLRQRTLLQPRTFKYLNTRLTRSNRRILVRRISRNVLNDLTF